MRVISLQDRVSIVDEVPKVHFAYALLQWCCQECMISVIQDGLCQHFLHSHPSFSHYTLFKSQDGAHLTIFEHFGRKEGPVPRATTQTNCLCTITAVVYGQTTLLLYMQLAALGSWPPGGGNTNANTRQYQGVLPMPERPNISLAAKPPNGDPN